MSTQSLCLTVSGVRRAKGHSISRLHMPQWRKIVLSLWTCKSCLSFQPGRALVFYSFPRLEGHVMRAEGAVNGLCTILHA